MYKYPNVDSSRTRVIFSKPFGNVKSRKFDREVAMNLIYFNNLFIYLKFTVIRRRGSVQNYYNNLGNGEF